MAGQTDIQKVGLEEAKVGSGANRASLCETKSAQVFRTKNDKSMDSPVALYRKFGSGELISAASVWKVCTRSSMIISSVFIRPCNNILESSRSAPSKYQENSRKQCLVSFN